MRIKVVAVFVAVLGAASLGAGAARAILFGSPDAANRYAGVGLVVFYDADNIPLWKCTGALISPTALLTAGHCAGADAATGFTPARAQVWFSNGYPKEIEAGTYITSGAAPGTPCTGYSGYPCSGGDALGTPRPHPAWPGTLAYPNTNDIGVVELTRPVSQPAYRLAPVGTLDGLTRKSAVSLTVVGYGIVDARPAQAGGRTRYVGTVQLLGLDKKDFDAFGIQLSANPSKGSGICFGDSGGPIFFGDQIVGISSWVQNDSCRGYSGAYRTDTQYARDFLAAYAR